MAYRGIALLAWSAVASRIPARAQRHAVIPPGRPDNVVSWSHERSLLLKSTEHARSGTPNRGAGVTLQTIKARTKLIVIGE
jgi:hypothetical protein